MIIFVKEILNSRLTFFGQMLEQCLIKFTYSTANSWIFFLFVIKPQWSITKTRKQSKIEKSLHKGAFSYRTVATLMFECFEILEVV